MLLEQWLAVRSGRRGVVEVAEACDMAWQMNVAHLIGPCSNPISAEMCTTATSHATSVFLSFVNQILSFPSTLPLSALLRYRAQLSHPDSWSASVHRPTETSVTARYAVDYDRLNSISTPASINTAQRQSERYQSNDLLRAILCFQNVQLGALPSRNQFCILIGDNCCLMCLRSPSSSNTDIIRSTEEAVLSSDGADRSPDQRAV